MMFIPKGATVNHAKIKKSRSKMTIEEEKYLMNGNTRERNSSSENDETKLTMVENEDELIYFNVSGKQFATTTKTLEVFPDSLLGNKVTRNKLQRTRFGEIFLNRHPTIFGSVLTFYQTGVFEPPQTVNQNIFVRDVIFFGLVKEAIASGLTGFDVISKPFPKRRWQAYLWSVLEFPDSSILARILSMLSLLTIIVSIVIFCWETLPEYRLPEKELSETKKFILECLNDVEIFCITYFTLELILRFVGSPGKLAFIKNILNIIDFISILPFFVTFIFSMESGVSIYFLRAIRLVRVFRVFKLSRHSNEMKILGIAVKDSGRELAVLMFFILLGVLLFSSAVYYAEGNIKGTKLQSIPGAFWWSIVTMTTVGYGDEVPVTTAGRLVGAVCAMTGILVIAMPIPIIVNNFTRQYQRLKPVSRFWNEFQEREKRQGLASEIVIGLFHLYDVPEFDQFVSQSRSRLHIPSHSPSLKSIKINNNNNNNLHNKTSSVIIETHKQEAAIQEDTQVETNL